MDDSIKEFTFVVNKDGTYKVPSVLLKKYNIQKGDTVIVEKDTMTGEFSCRYLKKSI